MKDTEDKDNETMKIGLIADTHIPEAMPELPAQVREVFAGVDLILHAGDLHCLDVLDWLEATAPVLAARGNGDDGSGGRPVVPDDPRLRDTQVVTCVGRIDIMVCGHTHVERLVQHDDVWVINPGSATFPHNLTAQPGTVGILMLDGDRTGVTIYDLKTQEPVPGLAMAW
jgi:predicted phosphodiesterase